MSKSNNHHCTPEFFGEQKGDFSPFFHIPSKNELQEILLKSREDASFLSEEDLQLLSTFFYIEKQKQFFSQAAESLKKRQAVAEEIQENTHKLSNEISELAKLFASFGQDRNTAIKCCARLAKSIEKETAYIHTNIIVCISNQIVLAEEENTFFQIKKEAFLLEIAYKILEKDLGEWENTKDILLSDPPSKLTSLASQVLELYNTIESHVTSQLVSAAKAAKANNTEKYVNILYETSRNLSDAANALKRLAET